MLKKRKVATMKWMRHQFRLSHMTVFRALKEYGYHTSYNYNAKYYTLRDIPQFDEWGLWACRDIRFSRYGTLLETIVALVEQAPAGATVRELEARLQTNVANLLSRLVHEGRLTQHKLLGRQVVYLAGQRKEADEQYRRRGEQAAAPSTAAGGDLPAGCSAHVVIDILRQVVYSPKANANELAVQLMDRGVTATPGQVQRVIEHYALEKKRHPSKSPS
jgi:hypothetical protein